MDADDPRWTELWGGYQVAYDPRPAIGSLRANIANAAAWSELWQELYHQGDIGTASYAAVAQVVDVYVESDALDWNPYALVATIDLARDNKRENIDVPEWLTAEYMHAITRLATHAIRQLPVTEDSESVRSMLAVLALWKGERKHARLLVEYTSDEIEELMSE